MGGSPLFGFSEGLGPSPHQKKKSCFLSQTMVPPAMGRRRANRSAALEPSFYTCLIEGLLEWRGGHFVLREQTVPQPSLNLKKKEEKPCLPLKPLAIPCTGAAPEHSWGQCPVAPGREAV